MIPPHVGAGRSRAHPTYEWDRPTRTPTPRIILNDSWPGALVECLLDHNAAPITRYGAITSTSPALAIALRGDRSHEPAFSSPNSRSWSLIQRAPKICSELMFALHVHIPHTRSFISYFGIYLGSTSGHSAAPSPIKRDNIVAETSTQNWVDLGRRAAASAAMACSGASPHRRWRLGMRKTLLLASTKR